jgi:hypothetical protein
MKDNKNLISGAIMAAVACGLFLTCATVWNLFEQEDPLSVLRVMADCCTVPAVLYIGIALLGWVGSKGMFDLFGYSISGLFRLFSKDAYKKPAETFYDYQTRKNEDRKPFNWPMLIVGLVFFLLALIITVIFIVMDS